MQENISFIYSSSLASVEYAYASKVSSSMDMLFMAGACPLNEDGEVLYVDDIEKQAKLCVSNLKVALEECGAYLEDVAYTRVLVASDKRADLVLAWNTIKKEFGELDTPSTLMGVTVLGYENQLVEIEAIAAKKSLK